MNTEISVRFEATPNPQSLKFDCAQALTTESVNFTSRAESSRSPLANKIFGFPWCAGVYIGPDFLTVTKQDWVDWDILAEPLAELIKEHLALGEPILYLSTTPGISTDVDNADDLPVVREIKRILREEIKPAVAMDGGDIQFERFENGRLFLSMHGACSGCPSSSYTLKVGIETRFKEILPEVLEVVAV